MPRCKECGSHVSKSFARVFGDNQNNVYGCIDCGVIASSSRHDPDLDHTRSKG